jgi:hypothetical protein
MVRAKSRDTRGSCQSPISFPNSVCTQPAPATTTPAATQAARTGSSRACSSWVLAKVCGVPHHSKADPLAQDHHGARGGLSRITGWTGSGCRAAWVSLQDCKSWLTLIMAQGFSGSTKNMPVLVTYQSFPSGVTWICDENSVESTGNSFVTCFVVGL